MKRVMICLLLLASFTAAAQEWEEKEMSGFSFEFPTPNEIQRANNGSAITYNDGNVYVTVTILPDSTEIDPQTQLELSRYYSMRLNTAAIRLRAKLQEANDTIISGHHMHFASARYSIPEGPDMNYDLLQFYQRDTLFGFSIQYNPSDESGTEIRNRFYKSLNFGKGLKRAGGALPSIPFIIGFGVVLFALGVYFVVKRRG